MVVHKTISSKCDVGVEEVKKMKACPVETQKYRRRSKEIWQWEVEVEQQTS